LAAAVCGPGSFCGPASAPRDDWLEEGGVLGGYGGGDGALAGEATVGMCGGEVPAREEEEHLADGPVGREVESTLQ
jgi:hypothetical protein